MINDDRQPTMQPSIQPVSCPTTQPSRQPTRQPTSQPSRQPTIQVLLLYLFSLLKVIYRTKHNYRAILLLLLRIILQLFSLFDSRPIYPLRSSCSNSLVREPFVFLWMFFDISFHSHLHLAFSRQEILLHNPWWCHQVSHPTNLQHNLAHSRIDVHQVVSYITYIYLRLFVSSTNNVLNMTYIRLLHYVDVVIFIVYFDAGQPSRQPTARPSRQPSRYWYCIKQTSFPFTNYLLVTNSRLLTSLNCCKYYASIAHPFHSFPVYYHYQTTFPTTITNAYLSGTPMCLSPPLVIIFMYEIMISVF